MGPLTTLAITRIGLDTYTFVLERPPDPEHPFAAPFVPCAEVRVPGEVVQVMRDRIADSVVGKSAFGRAGEDPFLLPGRALFDAFFPRNNPSAHDIRDALRGLGTPLLISTNEPETPWELLHDGEGFLGIKLALGRSLRDRSNVDANARGGADARERRCLLVSDPTGDLPSAAGEAKCLRETFESRGFVCESLEGSAATFEAVLDRLAGGRFTIFHYAGHICQLEEGEHSEFAFVLHDQRPLHASVVERCANAPEVVFLNGCQSAQMVEGLTRAFLRAGSRLVLGSLFNAPSRGAAAFSQAFYDVFLAGKSAGEAARSSRAAVLGGGNAAWACFVVYGDPRFAVGVDPLQAFLSAMQLKRANFSLAARDVLERGYALAGRNGVFTASHLFAALVQGTDNQLRNRLREKGVQPEKLASLFTAALGIEAPTGPSEVSASSSTRELLVAAVQQARDGGRDAAEELDLLRGLVRIKTASVWRILREVGIRPRDLDPDGGTFEIEAVGPVTRNDCDSRAWGVLCSAAALADREGAGVAGSPHLFSALLVAPEGALPAAFSRLQVPIDPLLKTIDGKLPTAGSPRIQCSPNAAEVLTLAQAMAAAASRRVAESDLLDAFIESGGGGAGAYLQSRGIVLRSLTSHLFLDGGLVDSGRFSTRALDVLDSGLEFARQKEYRNLGRRHLLYGLLSVKKGAMDLRLREQDRDSELLADLLHATLPPGGAPGHRLELRVSCLTTGVMKVLCAAESASLQEGAPEVDDRHLLDAWVEDGGGEGGSFLVQNNIRLRRLAEFSGNGPAQPH